jgi:hypothetical protein
MIMGSLLAEQDVRFKPNHGRPDIDLVVSIPGLDPLTDSWPVFAVLLEAGLGLDLAIVW